MIGWKGRSNGEWRGGRGEGVQTVVGGIVVVGYCGGLDGGDKSRVGEQYTSRWEVIGDSGRGWSSRGALNTASAPCKERLS